MLEPKRTKFRKQQKGRNKGIQSNQPKLSKGKFAIISLANARLSSNQIEAVRRVMSRKFKRSGQIWVLAHPSLSVSKKPLEVRMGKGKGSVSHWVCRIKKGQILYEMDGIDLSRAKQGSILANSKLPIKTLFYSI